MYELSDFGDTKPLRTAAKMPEKDHWRIEPAQQFTSVSDIYDKPARGGQENGYQLNEAADLYGDIDTAKDYGYVTRG